MELKNDFIHIWTKSHQPILFSKVFNVPSGRHEFHLFMEEYLLCIKSQSKDYPILFTLSDFSDISPPQLAVVIRFYADYIPAQLELGIVYKAFVRPKNLFSQFAIEDVIKNSDPDAVGVFDTFEDAERAVWRLRERSRNGIVRQKCAL